MNLNPTGPFQWELYWAASRAYSCLMDQWASASSVQRLSPLTSISAVTTTILWLIYRLCKAACHAAKTC